jgi:LysM repeat protein
MVKAGDTLESIANKFKTTPDVIKQINDDIDITVNKVIKVPKCCSKNFDYYVVLQGDTLYEIANKNNIDPTLLAQLNGINIDDYIYPNQVLLVPKAGSILYFTAVGDTLAEIAEGLNISLEELIDQNNNIYLQPEQLIIYKYK